MQSLQMKLASGKRHRYARAGSAHGQVGFTLIELMVAMVIGLLLTVAAVTALVVTRRGFTTVDAASQLRDNGRFAADVITRVAMQAGFKDTIYASQPPSQQDVANDAAGNVPSHITGFNNALIDTSTLDLRSAIARTTSDGSDLLVVRYQSAKLNGSASTTSDNSSINCSGQANSAIPTSRTDRMVSVFHIAADVDGEPSLMCTYWDTTSSSYLTVNLVRGVEDFQVLYGIDRATFTAVNTAFTYPEPSGDPLVPGKYLRADQLLVGGTMASQATYNNFRSVRSIRIGMILRGPANSAQDNSSTTLYPFGLAKDSATGTPGGALSSNNDTGTVFTPPSDGRLREVVTFTIHLRDDQGL